MTTRIRTDISVETLRQALKVESDGNVVRRLQGVIALLAGGSRREAQEAACLSINVFRTWIKRFNEFGIEGLYSIKPPGRPKRITPDIEKALKEKILKGPELSEGISRYRLCDMEKFLREDHGLVYKKSAIWRKFQELDITWKTGRQRHPRSDDVIQEDFKKNIRKN